ncbi:MAG TPA: hypothetical protein VMW91_09145 [Desulfosporosinus sp.]|nr:hypothetical protein [Desulfosporosinus sp.]
MARNVLSYKFQAAARDALREGCADGARITREALSAALTGKGYTVTPALAGTLIESGELNTSTEAWDLFRGRYGGIREVDMEAYQAELDAEAARAVKAAERAAKRAAKAAAKAGQAPEASEAAPDEAVAVAS